MRCSLVSLVASSSLLASAGCGPRVDCEALCNRTLACEVTFQPADDPSETKVQSGERTELESCVIGCEERDVPVDDARCVDALDVSDPTVCQEQVLDCLGYTPAQ